MYAKPEVTKYSGKELLDLMGPVETAYDCNIEIIKEGECSKVLRVIPAGDLDDYRARIGWEINPQDPGECDDRDGSGVVGDGLDTPEDVCFEIIEDGDGYIRVPVNVCCLADCTVEDGTEQWMLDLTLFRENGSEDTCDIELEVGRGGG